jgi:CARDB
MDSPMKAPATLALVALLLLAGVVALGSPAQASVHPEGASSSALTGNISGPTVLGYNAVKSYNINGTGGPAFAANGTRIGNVTFYASVSGVNLTDVSVLPASSGITNASGHPTTLSVGSVAEVLTLVVEITSTYQTANVSINLTYTVTVVQPYTLTMTLVNPTSNTVTAFLLLVTLDGATVGTIKIPTLTPGQSYTATFDYATLGLAAGEHTFTVSFENPHGGVTFAGGSTTYSTSFYIPGPPPDYTLWYVAGAVAFFGAIFIFVTRVAARRRNPSRK